MTVRFEYRARPGGPPDTLVYDLAGMLDSSKAIEGMAEEFCKSTALHFVLDFRQVTYINSTGFGALFMLVNDFAEAGRAVYVADPSPRARMVLEQLGGGAIVILTMAEALETIRKASK